MTFVPDIMPVLSPGRHRSPRSGGCFMEIASYLAGERWSDHPKSTHPTLAELARCVNDVLPDSRRSSLSPLIPSVIGTAGSSSAERTRLAAVVVRECTLVSLPLVSDKAMPLACALLVAERVLDEETHAAGAALAAQPQAALLARRFIREHPPGWLDRRGYVSLASTQAVRCAVRAVSDELGPEAPDVLIAMLSRATETARAACGLRDADDVPDQQWQAACALVGARPASG